MYGKYHDLLNWSFFPSSAPMDGVTLADSLHNRGINIRYLGKIASMLHRVTIFNHRMPPPPFLYA
jgi:hypothetical protein